MIYFDLVNAVLDMRSDPLRTRISFQNLNSICVNLAEIIKEGYKPDIIIAIATGGSMTGEILARVLNIPVTHMTVRRDIKIGRMYNHDPLPLRWIMSFYHHYLFRTKKPRISTEISIDVVGKKILIVDDTIHTGATIDVVVKYLSKAGVSDMKIATLAYVSKRKPDFYVLPKGNYCFPWSKDF